MDGVAELEDHLGFWLRFVSNHVSYGFAARLEATGVTVAEWVLLRRLYEHREIVSSGLAEAMGLTRGAVSKLVDRLVQKELVTRTHRADDRRYQDVGLTPAGRAMVPRLAALADENDAHFFAPLSAEEREELFAVMKKLVRVHELKKVPTE